MNMYQKNEIYTVTITDLGAEGEGIGKIDGYPLFVKDALPGDVIEARLTKVKKTYAYARMEKLLQPSPDRIDAVCPYARQCGGCQIQALSYRKQLEYKERKVFNNLIRLGGVPEKLLTEIMEPIIGMQPEDWEDNRIDQDISDDGHDGIQSRIEEGTVLAGDHKTQTYEVPVRYRNKAQYPFGTDKEGKTVCGFYAGRTHNIIANTNCLLGAKENEDILKAVLSYMEESHVKPYCETTGKGLLRHVLIRKSKETGQIMVCIIINGKALPQKERLLQKLKLIPGISSVSISPNEKNTNVILGDTYEMVWGESKITDKIYQTTDVFQDDSQNHFCDKRPGKWMRTAEKGIRFRISPLSFYQVNPVQMERLYSTALEYAGLTGKETVWDLYCGIGTISLFLARKARHVYGVEIVPQAIEDAKENAALNQIDNVTFYLGKAEEVLPQFYEGLDIVLSESERENGKQFNVLERERKEEIIGKEEREITETGERPEEDKRTGQAEKEMDQMRRPDVIVVDPPRKGCDEGCLSTMVRMNPERIVYVSCDSATLARDVMYLREYGYELRRVRACDMFPNTGHVETVCLIVKTKCRALY